MISLEMTNGNRGTGQQEAEAPDMVISFYRAELLLPSTRVTQTPEGWMVRIPRYPFQRENEYCYFNLGITTGGQRYPMCRLMSQHTHTTPGQTLKPELIPVVKETHHMVGLA